MTIVTSTLGLAQPRSLALACLLVAAWFASGCAWCNDEDERFVAGLRQRRLFLLAETFCQQRLSQEPLEPTERVRLVVELIRVHTEHALHAPRDERDRLWRQARDAATAFFQDAAHPQAILVRVQDALTLLARGEFERREAEVAPDPEQALAAVRQTLREAIVRLTEIDRELSDARGRRPTNSPRRGEFSEASLLSLQQHVRHHLAAAYEHQALSFPAHSSDRTASLTAVLEQLKQPLSQLTANDPLGLAVRLRQARCLRLVGDAAGALRYLEELASVELGPRQALELRAERIRTLLAVGRRDQALEVVGEGRQLEGASSPELDAAQLETYISLWTAAVDEQDRQAAAQWREQVVTTAKFIEQTHGAYWGRYAELLLIRRGAGQRDGSAEVLARLADEAYRQGRHEEAVAAYDVATAAARAEEDESRAFELAYRAALVQQERRLFEDAADRFRTLAIEQASHPQAGNAHLLAIANVRQASAAAGQWQAAYADMLREQLARWPNDAKTADVAALWLGELEAGHEAWEAAIKAYQQVSANSRGHEAAVRALGTCWLRHLAALRQAQQPLAELTDQARSQFQQVLTGADGKWPTEWSPAQRQAALALATLQLQFRDAGFRETEELLQLALGGQPPPEEIWRVSATSLLLQAVARQSGRRSAAHDLVRQLESASIDKLMELFRELGTALANNSVGQRELALVRLEVTDLLQRRLAELTEAQRAELARGRADTLALAGETEQAIGLYAELAKQAPQDGEIQEAYAKLLTERDDPQTQRAALAQWRLVAAKSEPRTARWYRAKYGVAFAQYKLGQKTDAAKLIRYLQATEDLAASGLEAEFQQLLLRCDP